MNTCLLPFCFFNLPSAVIAQLIPQLIGSRDAFDQVQVIGVCESMIKAGFQITSGVEAVPALNHRVHLFCQLFASEDQLGEDTLLFLGMAGDQGLPFIWILDRTTLPESSSVFLIRSPTATPWINPWFLTTMEIWQNVLLSGEHPMTG